MRSFTLLELIVVIIIIGILASLGFGQYTSVIEKARAAEARMNLSTLRQLQVGYYHDKNKYTAVSYFGLGLPDNLSYDCVNDRYYFNYFCATDAGTCYALRCESGGKDPNNKAEKRYYISLSISGDFSGTPGWH